MSVTLHRYSREQTPGDLTRDDLRVLWGLMLAEGLVETFFHDGSVRRLDDFIAWATASDTWLHAAKRGGEWIGFGAVNAFSSSGNTAHAHLCSFACGRDGSFREAGRQWFALLSGTGLATVVAMLPACYRGARFWAESFEFVEKLRLPGAIRLHRAKGERVTDAVIYIKRLEG